MNDLINHLTQDIENFAGDFTHVESVLYRQGNLIRRSRTGVETIIPLGIGIETDPTVPGFVKAITSTQVSNWDTTYSWGNHALAGYLTTESDTLDTVTTRGNTTLNTITVGGITATGVTSTIYAGAGTRLRTEANNLVFERVSSSGFMKVYINQTTLSPTAKAYMGYNNATLNVILSNEHSTGNLELRTQDIVRQYIFANGNVVIGSASPTDAGYKLDVIGLVRTQEIRTGAHSFRDQMYISHTTDGYTKQNAYNAANAYALTFVGDLRFASNATIKAVFAFNGSYSNNGTIYHGDSSLMKLFTGDAFGNTIGATNINGYGVNLMPTLNYTTGTSTFTGFFYNPTVTATTGLTHYAMDLVTGVVKLRMLAGTGDRMVVADSNGVLSTQAIPSGSGATPTLAQVTTAGNTTTNAITVGGLTVATNLIYTDTVNGRVGIGTNSPAVTLHVQNGGSTPKALFQHGTLAHLGVIIGSTGGGFTVEDNNFFAIWHQDYANRSNETGLTERMRITTGGNILIGTTTDSGYKLDINGNLRNTNGAYFATTSGNVGIGTISPYDKLEVNGAISATGALSANSAQAHATTLSVESGISYLHAVDWGVEYKPLQVRAQTISLQTGGGSTTDRLFINSTGNVGIGTTNPAYKLQVQGSVYFNGTTNDFYVDGVARFGGTNSYSTVINSGGDVGLGITPTAKLQVAGLSIFTNSGGSNYNENIRLPEATAGWSSIVMGGAIATSGTGATVWSIIKQPSGYGHRFSIRNNATDYLTIFTNGNVGLGVTSDAGYKLDVNGALRVLSISAGTVNYNRFLVSDSGVVKYRVASEMLSDIDVPGYVSSRGENLVTNGTGLRKSNYNFSTFTFVGSDAYFSTGSFQDATFNTARSTDEAIPVDVNQRYRLSVSARQNPYVGARYYVGVSLIDADGFSIIASHHMYKANTLTTLAAPLNPGDTVMYLTSAANWENGGTAGVNTHLRSIILWNYVNSLGYAFPALTYSRNYYGNMWDPGSVNTTTNTITLRVPWAGPVVAAGTQLSNGSSGGTYKYITVNNVQFPNVWTNYTGTIEGVDLTGTNVDNKFAPGTAAIKILFLNNRDVVGATVYYTNVQFGLDLKNPNTHILNGTSLQTANFNISGNGYIGGNVGIGTASPGDKLEVSGNVYANAFNAIGTLTRYNSTGGIAVIGLSGNTYGTIQAYSNAGGAGKSLSLQPGGGNVLIGTTTDAGYKLDVNGTLRSVNGAYFATSSGSVGIGTTSPAYNLHTIGTIAVGTANSLNGTLRIERSSGNTGLIFRGSDGYIIGAGFVPVYEPYNYASADHNFNIGHASAGNFNWYAGNNAILNSNTHLMRLTRGGNLLIGTTTDSGYRLDVNGTARVQGDFTCTSLVNNGPVMSLSGVLTSVTGYTGMYTVPTNPPGQQTLVIQDGIIVNVM